MLVFIDESGDAGFRLDKGSSPDFVVAMVIIESAEHARETEAAIQSVRRQLGLRGEFKFSKLKNEWRDVFFQRLRSCPFSVRAIVVQKDLIYSPHLRAKKDDFHRFFVQKMVMHDGGLLDRAKVVVDGSGDRKFQDSFRSYLRKHAKERIESVRFVDSKTDQLVQLADMCVGAIARSYKWDKKDAARWRDALQARIDDVWDSDRCAPALSWRDQERAPYSEQFGFGGQLFIPRNGTCYTICQYAYSHIRVVSGSAHVIRN